MKRVLLTSAAVLMSLSMGAFAETSTTPSGAAVPPHAATTPAHPGMASNDSTTTTGTVHNSATARDAASAPPVTANSSDMFASVPPGEELSSKVVGLDVYNSDNKSIGKIKDVAFDQSGVKAYIVAVGGFLGMGDRYVAVNPSAVHINYDSNAKKWHAAMNTDASQLKSAPEYKYSSND